MRGMGSTLDFPNNRHVAILEPFYNPTMTGQIARMFDFLEP